MPQDAPQTISTHISSDFYIKIKYTVKAQFVPVQMEMLTDKKLGKSKLRCKEYISVSIPQPFVADPRYELMLPIEKSVGLSKLPCNGSVQISKNYFYPGEIAYFTIFLDNSAISDKCELIISLKCKLKGL